MDSVAASFKISVLGSFSVGKTALVSQYLYNRVPQTKMTEGKEVFLKIIEMEEYKIRLDIWDTAGQERFRAMTGDYLRGADGIILVYDITSRNSFAELKYWLDQLKLQPYSEIKKVLVGNKLDLEERREVETQEGNRMAASNKMLFYETSATASDNVEAVFSRLAREVYEERMRKYDISLVEERPISRDMAPIKLERSFHASIHETRRKNCCK